MSKTFNNAAAYPLCWPPSFAVTKHKSDNNRFRTTLHKALLNVQSELSKFGSDSNKKIEDVVISSNYNLSDSRPREAGVAVYFTWDGDRTCIPVDKYTLVEDNLQAIYYCIQAKRTMLRHGGINLVKAAFRGYAALPDPNNLNWRQVLGYEGDDVREAKKLYIIKIREAHPDRNNGNGNQATVVNAAWEQCQAQLNS